MVFMSGGHKHDKQTNSQVSARLHKHLVSRSCGYSRANFKTMKIKKITWQHRRDFAAIYECEFCGHNQSDDAGYDDRFYHDNVIPNKKCDKCGKSTKSENGIVGKTPTKYPEGFQV